MTTRRRYLVPLLLACSILANAVLLYRLADLADLHGDTAVELDRVRADRRMLAGALPLLAGHAGRPAVLRALRTASPHAFIVSDSAGIGTGGLRFSFGRSGLVGVVTE